MSKRFKVFETKSIKKDAQKEVKGGTGVIVVIQPEQ